jgi:hypothetical protein
LTGSKQIIARFIKSHLHYLKLKFIFN